MSKYSSPSSSDGFKKPVNKNRSLRGKSGKKPSGQKGHNGSYLTVLSGPDLTEDHLHIDCENCPHYEQCRKAADVKETRYVINAVIEVVLQLIICFTYHAALCEIGRKQVFSPTP